MRSSLLALLVLTISPAWGHSLDELQAELRQREPAAIFEAGVGTPFPVFHLTDLAGKTVDLSHFRGHIMVVDFVATDCTEGCPTLTDLMAKLQRDVTIGHMANQVDFISITTDPEHDTPEVRRSYGVAHHLDPANWQFLAPETSRAGRDLASRLGLSPVPDRSGPPAYPSVTYVVDSAGKLRARFTGLNYDPLNAVLYINALTNDHHELQEVPPVSSFWATLKSFL